MDIPTVPRKSDMGMQTSLGELRVIQEYGLPSSDGYIRDPNCAFIKL